MEQKSADRPGSGCFCVECSEARLSISGLRLFLIPRTFPSSSCFFVVSLSVNTKNSVYTEPWGFLFRCQWPRNDFRKTVHRYTGLLALFSESITNEGDKFVFYNIEKYNMFILLNKRTVSIFFLISKNDISSLFLFSLTKYSCSKIFLRPGGKSSTMIPNKAQSDTTSLLSS